MLKKLLSLERRYLANNYKSLPVMLSHGRGKYVWDINQERYYDFLSSYSANNQGHCHPKILNTMVKQASRLTLTSRAFHNDMLYKFGDKITNTFGYEKVLPMNTGVEAGETAVKIARKWGYEVKGIEFNEARIIFPKNNFWGRTISACSTQNEKESYTNFGPFPPNFDIVPYNNLNILEKQFQNRNVAGYFFEPIQGEAGVIIPDEKYLKGVRDLCNEYRVLMIADEVQTGMGRTGELYACKHSNIKPDILVLGKALGGGVYPVSAVLADNSIMDVITPGTHGSTFGGNPLGCAVAMESIDVLLEENMIENSKKMGEILRNGLNNIKHNSYIINGVRGKGLMNAVEIIDEKTCERIVSSLAKDGVLCKSTRGNIIRLSPPLILNEEDIKNVLEIFERVIFRESQYRMISEC